MTATAVEIATPRKDNRIYGRKMAAAKILAGTIVCLNAQGYATPGATSTTLKADGVAQETIDNSTGAAGDQTIRIVKGAHRFKNSAAGDAITIADIGNDCYVVDNQTVAKTNGTNTRSVAGKITDVDALGVWVDFR